MRILPLLLVLLLAACQSQNPYQPDSLPLPPAPEGVEHIVDMSAYPATPVDMSRYRSWQWQSIPGDARLADAVSSGLDQIGLRPVRGDRNADVFITAYTAVEQRERQYYNNVGGYYGYGHHRHWDRYGAYGSVPVVQTYIVDVQVVRIDFFDGKTGQRLWSTRGETSSTDSNALYTAVNAALTPYPPQ